MEKLKKRELLSVLEESKMCRAIKDRVEEQTLSFSMSDARVVAALLLEQHDHLIFKNDKPTTTSLHLNHAIT